MAASVPLVETIEQVSVVPLCLVLLPILGSFIVYWSGRYLKEAVRNYLAIIISAACFLLSVYLFYLAGHGDVVYRVSSFLDFGLNFRVDLFGSLFTLLSSFIWLLAMVFSWSYMEHEHARGRYYYFMTLTLGGCLGVFLMEDFFGLLLFFELMSLASYVLVIHAETEEAMEAGRSYLYLGIIGGLAILSAIFLLYTNVGTAVIAPLLEQMELSFFLRYLIAALFIIGFGIKAGMAPLHIWLPKAHPVAPSPASALLSGIMIKTGAYGIIRVVNMLFTPVTPHTALWAEPARLGYIIIWFGIITMFMAAFIALFQTNAKRILAYSSISQMGYILMGIGCAAYLGYEGSLALAGTTYHILNHAFFKAGMFMMVGAVYARTHELELSRLGGLYLGFPFTALAFLVCACGIAGVPGFNGYISKTLLHHAIVEAYEHHHAVSLYWAEKIFMLTSAFTVCYITKLYTSIFFGHRPFGLKRLPGEESSSEKAVFTTLAAAIVLMGLLPLAMLKKIVTPALRGFVYDAHGVEHLLHLNFWSWHDLQGIAVALGLGLIFFYVFSHSGVFTWRLPAWLSVEYLFYRPAVAFGGAVYMFSGKAVETVVDGLFVKNISPLSLISKKVAIWDDSLDECILQPAIKTAGKLYFGGIFLNSASEAFWVESRKPLLRCSQWLNYLDSVLLVETGKKTLLLSKYIREFFYGLCFRVIKFCLLLGRGYGRKAFWTLIKMDYDYKGEEFYNYFNILNFDFDFLLLFIVLASVLIIGLLLV